MVDDHLLSTLKASGVVYPLVFRINEDGETELLDESGYALIWGVEDATFTFPETVALGTPSLPTVILKFRDEEGNIVGFRIPMHWSLMILKDLESRLWSEYEKVYKRIGADFKNATSISKAKSTLIRHKVEHSKEDEHNDDNLFI